MRLIFISCDVQVQKLTETIVMKTLK